MFIRKLIVAAATSWLLSWSLPAAASNQYKLDVSGMHASINFKVSHLGYSWVLGRFDTFNGEFTYNPDQIQQSKIAINIQTNSVNSNHSLRDSHLRGKKFLDVKQYPDAKFVSTSIKPIDDKNFDLIGNFTLKDVTKQIVIRCQKIGHGKDPWGGYRAGFTGSTEIELPDYHVSPVGLSTTAKIELHIEGVRS